MASKPKSILFIHPDLGIGGAERLVVDAAMGLQDRGHKVVIYTSHCDKAHAFDEARDGTLDVRVRGNTIVPANILGQFAILCAILRQLHLAANLIVTGELRKHDAIFIDQLSACIPILRSFSNAKILFYCHFPDKLLAQRRSLIKKLYRIPFDLVEAWTTGCAHGIVVNSKFTMGVFKQEFPSIKITPRVVYPSVDTEAPPPKFTDDESGRFEGLSRGKKVALSINRFERKKDIELAIEAYSGLSEEERRSTRLIVAGGYDSRVAENVQYHNELIALCDKLKLSSATSKNFITAMNLPDDIEVMFLLSIPSSLKYFLLRTSTLLLYTPENEHFGIVPLEAGLAGIPVLATSTGGPLESIVDGETGWLRPRDETEWTRVLRHALFECSAEKLQSMGETARERVKTNFSKAKMAENLEKEFIELEKVPSGGFPWGIAGAVGVALAITAYFAFQYVNVI